MDAYLFEGAPPVQILPEALAMGGSWEGNAGRAQPLAWGAPLIKRVYDFLKPLDAAIMVDVGANTGSYSLLPALLPNVYVKAFEPCSTVYDMLVENLAANDLDVVTYQCALSNLRGEALLALPADHASGCATLGNPVRYQPVGVESVTTLRLDEFTFARLDFLKIDTEGAEKFVLQGAEQTIRKHRPTMLIECQPMNTAAFGYPVEDILALVESYGYTYEWCGDEDIWCEAR